MHKTPPAPGAIRRDETRTHALSVDEAPTTSSSFRLVRELGRGGMGVVHEAVDVRSGRRVALKVLSPDIEYTDADYRRFEREARLAASIAHPRCVFVLGVHQHDGLPAIAMELMSGQTLADRLKDEQPIPIVTAVRWMLDVLEGLIAGHRVGVIHRDIKPSNCYLTEDGRVKVGDFGLARALVPDLSLTQTGKFLGSPAFASPEQVRGDAMDERTDVYSVGATLHTLIAGTAPYDGSGLGEVLSKILTEDPPKLRSLRPEVPRGLARLISRCMRRQPKGRPVDAVALMMALRPWAALGVAAPLVPRLRAVLIDIGLVFMTMLVVSIFPMMLLFSLPERPDEEIKIAEQVTLFLIRAGLLAYYPVVEAWRGGSRGKRVVGLRVVAHSTGLPSPARAALRGVLTTGILLGLWAGIQFALGDAPNIGMAWVVGLLSIAGLFVTARRRNGYRGLHELLSGTKLVMDVAQRTVRGENLSILHQAHDASGPLRSVGSWNVEAVVGSTPTGQLLSARDARLERSVWIDVGPARKHREVRGPSGLHLLESVHEQEQELRVYEDPGGASVLHYLERGRRLPWSLARDVLEQVVQLLEHSDRPLCTEQLWIDKDLQVRVLDRPLASSQPPERDEISILRDVTEAILSPGVLPPPDLPFHAEELVARLKDHEAPYESLDAVADELKELASHRPVLSNRTLNLLRLLVVSGTVLLSLIVPALTIDDGERTANILVSIVLSYGVPASSLALLLRGGLGLLIAGIGVRSAAGARASRWRCAARSLLTWTPVWACLQGAYFVSKAGWDARIGWVLNGAAVVILLAIVVLSSRAGSLSLQDRIAGTRLVPR
jgi:uncharacterized RDD family membrane protein YckC